MPKQKKKYEDFTDEERTRALVIYLDNNGDLQKVRDETQIPVNVLKKMEKNYDWQILKAQVNNRLAEEVVEDVVARKKRNIRMVDFIKSQLIRQIRDGGLACNSLEKAVDALNKTVELEHRLLGDEVDGDKPGQSTNLFVLLGQEIKQQEELAKKDELNPYDSKPAAGDNVQ